MNLKLKLFIISEPKIERKHSSKNLLTTFEAHHASNTTDELMSNLAKSKEEHLKITHNRYNKQRSTDKY